MNGNEMDVMAIASRLKQLLIQKSFGQIGPEEYVAQKNLLLQRYRELAATTDSSRVGLHAV